MYGIRYEDELFWITYNDVVIKELGGFIDPLTPEIIIKEIKDEV